MIMLKPLCAQPHFVCQVKELPTYKDNDFRNSMQKVYVSEEEKEKIMDKLSRDIEVMTNILSNFFFFLCWHACMQFLHCVTDPSVSARCKVSCADEDYGL